jgi:uncharacterized tellurite resistance protein B-like protein
MPGVPAHGSEGSNKIVAKGVSVSIRDWFRTLGSEPSPQADTDTVRRIVSELDRMEPERARYLAAFAYVLSRVAGADLHITDAETDKMVELVQRAGNLPAPQAVMVVEIAKSQNRLFGGTEDFLVTREFREIASETQRYELLECLFAVSAADDEVAGEEEAQIRQIASELGFSHAEYIQVRLKYMAKRNVFGQDRP